MKTKNPRRKLRIDALTTDELHARIERLPHSNAQLILCRVRDADRAIERAEQELTSAKKERLAMLREVYSDLLDWKPGTLRRVGLVLPADPNEIAPSPFAP